MDSWPTADEFREIYDELCARIGRHKVSAELARRYGVSEQTARRHIKQVGLRTTRERVVPPQARELASAYDAAIAAHGRRLATGKLAVTYGVTTTTIRQWLAREGLCVPKPRVPARPITEPCPCGAPATTRYKDQDPALCFRCYMRTYAADKTSNFKRTARVYIADIKANAVCADCGGKFPPCVYHFDHVPERGPKIFNLGSGDYSIEAVQAEIAKCDIVCANCHAIRTWITRKKSA